MKRIAGLAVSMVFAVSAAAAADSSRDEAASSAKSGEVQRLPEPKGRPSFSSLDRDGDGSISRVEASVRKELLVDFDQIDLTRDSRLDAAEYRSYYSAGYGEY
jgi:hypothetical protein